MNQRANLGLTAAPLVGMAVWTPPARTEPVRDRHPREHLGTTLERATLVRLATEARASLREAAFAAAEAAARARAVADELDQALAALRALEFSASAALPAISDGPRGNAGLSPREREVLALVAEGRSNKAIAAALYVSPNTVKTHVASLFSKLQADSRAQLAAIAAQQRLP